MDWKTEIETGPLAAELAPFVAAGNDGQVAAILNDKTRGGTRLQYRLLSARGILADYADGPMAAAAMLDKLEAASVSVSAIKWVMTFLKSDGIDIGHPATQGMIDQLAAGGVLTTTEATNLKALGIVPASRAEVLGATITHIDVAKAMRGE
jgi:hypothetical protein